VRQWQLYLRVCSEDSVLFESSRPVVVAVDAAELVAVAAAGVAVAVAVAAGVAVVRPVDLAVVLAAKVAAVAVVLVEDWAVRSSWRKD